MTINLAQQVVLGNLVFQTKVVEQRSGARLLTHHFGVPLESYLAHSNSSHQKERAICAEFFNSLICLWHALKAALGAGSQLVSQLMGDQSLWF